MIRKGTRGLLTKKARRAARSKCRGYGRSYSYSHKPGNSDHIERIVYSSPELADYTKNLYSQKVKLNYGLNKLSGDSSLLLDVFNRSYPANPGAGTYLSVYKPKYLAVIGDYPILKNVDVTQLDDVLAVKSEKIRLTFSQFVVKAEKVAKDVAVQERVVTRDSVSGAIKFTAQFAKDELQDKANSLITDRAITAAKDRLLGPLVEGLVAEYPELGLYLEGVEEAASILIPEVLSRVAKQDGVNREFPRLDHFSPDQYGSTLLPPDVNEDLRNAVPVATTGSPAEPGELAVVVDEIGEMHKILSDAATALLSRRPGNLPFLASALLGTRIRRAALLVSAYFVLSVKLGKDPGPSDPLGSTQWEDVLIGEVLDKNGKLQPVILRKYHNGGNEGTEKAPT